MKTNTILYSFQLSMITFLTAMALSIVSCGEKKKADDIITKKVAQPRPSAPIRMQESDVTQTISWLGKDYLVRIHRQPLDSVIVKDPQGQPYIDNTIVLTVKRSDGSQFFSQTFTKQSFRTHLEGDYLATGILEGLVFDKVEDDVLCFAASVCHPQTDEYIPLIVKVSRMGAVTMSRDNRLDTAADD